MPQAKMPPKPKMTAAKLTQKADQADTYQY
jgi:hypothetical protein